MEALQTPVAPRDTLTGTGDTITREDARRFFAALSHADSAEPVFSPDDLNTVFDSERDDDELLCDGAKSLVAMVSFVAIQDDPQLPDSDTARAAFRLCRAALDVLDPQEAMV